MAGTQAQNLQDNFNIDTQTIHNLAHLLYYSNLNRSCFGHPSCDLSQDGQLSATSFKLIYPGIRSDLGCDLSTTRSIPQINGAHVCIFYTLLASLRHDDDLNRLQFGGEISKCLISKMCRPLYFKKFNVSCLSRCSILSYRMSFNLMSMLTISRLSIPHVVYVNLSKMAMLHVSLELSRLSSHNDVYVACLWASLIHSPYRPMLQLAISIF